MNHFGKYFSIIILITILWCSCQEKKFKHIRFKATLADWFNNKSLSGSMYVRAWHTLNALNLKEKIEFAQGYNSDADGHFDVVIHAYKSKKYGVALSVPGQKVMDTVFIANDNSVVDLGSRSAPHLFTCKVILNSVSQSGQLVLDDEPLVVHTPGGSGTFYVNHELTKAQYEAAGHAYVLKFHRNGVANSVSLPIADSDTVMASLSY